MTTFSSERNPIDELAEEFAERYRRGERPALQDYVDQYPQWADDIRRLFPALVIMERARPDSARVASDSVALHGTKAPQQLGDFRILREVGRGGMGIVYEAEQESLGRRVALKVLLSASLDARQLLRFQREAKTAARMHHTNIVPVFGVGEQDGLHYFVMQFIPGQGLDQVLLELRRLRGRRSSRDAPIDFQPSPSRITDDPKPSAYGSLNANLSATLAAEALLTDEFPLRASGQPANSSQPLDKSQNDIQTGATADTQPASLSAVALPGQSAKSQLSESDWHYWRSVARVGIQVAEALEYAQSQGVLHRDIKPSNLLLDQHGTVWVTDFGLAKAADSDDLTHTGDIVGTLRYMAPERFSGKSDVRSDIYGLGLTLYELLTFASPFEATDRHRLIHQITTEELPRPGRLNSSIPRDLETIVLKSVARESAHRYQTAAEMADDLKRFLEDRPIRARPLNYIQRMLRWCRRYPSQAALLGIIFTLMVAVLIGALWSARRDRILRAEADESRDQAEKNTEENRKLLVRQYLTLGMQAVDDGDLAGALPWLVEALRRDSKDPAREAIHRRRIATVWRQCPSLKQVWFHSGPVWDAQFSPDGRLVATACHDGSAQVWDVETGQPVGQPMRHSSTIIRVAFGAGSDRVATASWDGSARVWNSQTGEPLTEPLKHGAGAGVAQVSFDAAGERLVTASNDGTARSWDAATGKLLATCTGHTQAVVAAVFSPDGKWIATASNDQTACVWDAQTGKLMFPPLAHTQPLNSVQFSADSGMIVTAGGGWKSLGEVRVWDARNGQPITRPLMHDGNGVLVASFNPDGRFVVTGGWGSAVRIWSVKTSTLIIPPIEHGSILQHVEFSPDGQWVLAAGYDKTARVWDATTGQPVTPPLKHTSFVLRAAFSPDGQHVVTASWDHTTKVWDLATNEAITSVKVGGLTYAACFSHDGRRFVTSDDVGVARIWDTDSGQPVCSLQHGGIVTYADFAADDKVLLTSSRDRTARLWDTAGGQLLGTFQHNSGLTHAEFSADGSHIVTGCEDGTAQVWNRGTGQPVGLPMKHAGTVTMATFSPDGKRVLTASLDHSARLWDADTGQPLLPPLQHASEIVDACFSPNGRWLATAVRDGSLEEREAQVWDVITGKKIGAPLRHSDGVLTVLFSPDSQRVVTASEDSTARIWEAATGRQLTPPLRHAHQVLSARFSHQGQLVLTTSFDGTARVWDAATGEAVSPPLRHTNEVWWGEFSPDDRRVLTASDDGTTKIWDLTTDGRSIESLQLDSLLLSAHALDSSGELTPSDTSELQETWAAGRSRSGESVPTSDEPRIARHEREVLCLSGHTGTVHMVAFSPDAKTLASAGDDRTVRIWDTAEGQLRQTLSGHKTAPIFVAFSPDGGTLASTDYLGTTILWDTNTSQKQLVLADHADSNVNAAVFSGDGRLLATASSDRTVKVRDADTGKVRMTLQHERSAVGLAFSPDNKTLFCGGGDWSIPKGSGEVKVWDLETGQQRLNVSGQFGSVWSVALSKDGKTLAGACLDGTVRLWDAVTGQEQDVLKGHTDRLLWVAYSPDGETLASSSFDGSIRLWDAATGQERDVLHGHLGQVTRCSFSFDGRWLASAGHDGTVRLWRLQLPDSRDGLDNKRQPQSPASSARALDVARLEEVHNFVAHNGEARCVTVSSDGARVASCGHDGMIRVWDLESKALVHSFAAQQPTSSFVAFWRDSKRILSTGHDSVIRVWNVETGELLTSLSGHTSEVRQAVISPDGSQILSGSGGDDATIRIWDAASGQEVQRIPTPQKLVWGVAFSPDGKRALSGGWDNSVRLWDLASGSELQIMSGHTDFVLGVLFCPDGRRAISCSRDKTIRLWDVTTGEQLREFSGHERNVEAIALSPDSRWIASAGYDGSLRIWDLESGEQRMQQQAGTIFSLAFTPDGQHLLSAGADGSVRLWRLHWPERLHAEGVKWNVKQCCKSPLAGNAVTEFEVGKVGVYGNWRI